MKVDYSAYQLKPVNGGTERQGALVRITFPDNTRGYADLHPWTEWGDEVLSKQLERLKLNQPSHLTRQTIWMAQKDAQARKEKRNLVNGELKNNFLINDIDEFDTTKLDGLSKRGFTTIKIKVGRDTGNELNLISKIASTQRFQMRLDFNFKTNFKDFISFVEKLGKQERELLQYTEDPFPYQEEEWKEARKLTNLAADFAAEAFDWVPEKVPQCDVVILKPARREVEKAVACLRAWKKPFSVTSSMDHVVGVVHAQCVAQDLSKILPGQMLDPGCFTFLQYKAEPYSSALNTKGPYILASEGSGIGFDLLLDKEPWKPLF